MKKVALFLSLLVMCLSLSSCQSEKIPLGFYQIDKAQEFNEYSTIGITLEENDFCTVNFSMTGDFFTGGYSVKGNALTLSLDILWGEYINNTDINLEYAFEISDDGSLVFKGHSGNEIKYIYNITGEELTLKETMHFEKGDKFVLQNADNNESFKAKVLEVYDFSIVVEPLKNEEERKSSNKINVDIPKQINHRGGEFNKDDIVTIVYNGEILETYPASLGQVFDIQLSK